MMTPIKLSSCNNMTSEFFRSIGSTSAKARVLTVAEDDIEIWDSVSRYDIFQIPQQQYSRAAVEDEQKSLDVLLDVINDALADEDDLNTRARHVEAETAEDVDNGDDERGLEQLMQQVQDACHMNTISRPSQNLTPAQRYPYPQNQQSTRHSRVGHGLSKPERVQQQTQTRENIQSRVIMEQESMIPHERTFLNIAHKYTSGNRVLDAHMHSATEYGSHGRQNLDVSVAGFGDGYSVATLDYLKRHRLL